MRRIIAFLTNPESVDAILRHLGLPANPPLAQRFQLEAA